mmetsp:Transcript_77521/g.240130  ORF Transcript_77521/g.240130 Transcript_77521/m.240130 type:complete len:226 (+) Transcript_77521:106-783(+)
MDLRGGPGLARGSRASRADSRGWEGAASGKAFELRLHGPADGLARRLVQRGQEGPEQAAPLPGLRLPELLGRAEVGVGAGRLLRALPHVRVRVAAAVRAAPGAEGAAAAGAGEGEAAVEVHEGLAAARALAREDLLLDVDPRLEDLPLFLLECGHPIQLGRQLLLHLRLQLLDLALLEQIHARLDVALECGRGEASSQVSVGKVQTVTFTGVLGAEHATLMLPPH